MNVLMSLVWVNIFLAIDSHGNPSGVDQQRKEGKGNVLFNNVLNIIFTVIWRRTYDKGPLSQRGNPLLLLLHGLLFPFSSKFLYTPSHRQESTYHGLCYTSR